MNPDVLHPPQQTVYASQPTIYRITIGPLRVTKNTKKHEGHNVVCFCANFVLVVSPKAINDLNQPGRHKNFG